MCYDFLDEKFEIKRTACGHEEVLHIIWTGKIEGDKNEKSFVCQSTQLKIEVYEYSGEKETLTSTMAFAHPFKNDMFGDGFES